MEEYRKLEKLYGRIKQKKKTDTNDIKVLKKLAQGIHN